MMRVRLSKHVVQYITVDKATKVYWWNYLTSQVTLIYRQNICATYAVFSCVQTTFCCSLYLNSVWRTQCSQFIRPCFTTAADVSQDTQAINTIKLCSVTHICGVHRLSDGQGVKIKHMVRVIWPSQVPFCCGIRVKIKHQGFPLGPRHMLAAERF